MEIEQNQRIALEESARKAQEVKAGRKQKLENYKDKIIYFGLWKTESDINAVLGEIETDTEKREALKVQSNSRKKGLKQMPPKVGY